MNDKELYQGIVNVNCPFMILRLYLRKEDYQWKSSYADYFSVKTMLRAIEKYLSGEIDEKYLRRWAQAYYNLVEDGFENIDGKSTLTKELMGYFRFYLLGLQSYEEKGNVWLSATQLKRAITKFGRLLHDVDDCRAVYARKRAREKCGRLLIVNDKSKYYAIAPYSGGRYDEDEEFTRISNYKLNKHITQLLKQGYTKLN